MGTSELLGGPPFSLESSGIPQDSQFEADLTSTSGIKGGRGHVYLVNPKSGLAWPLPLLLGEGAQGLLITHALPLGGLSATHSLTTSLSSKP